MSEEWAAESAPTGVVVKGRSASAQLGDGSTTGTTGTATTTALPPGSGITHVTATTSGKSGFAY